MKKVLTTVPPSSGSKSEYYREFQRSFPILDGRYNLHYSTSTVGPSIEIYHPAFASFIDDIQNNHHEVPTPVLKATSKLMVAISALHLTERTRTENITRHLSDALSYGSVESRNPDRTAPDATIILPLGDPINEWVPLLVREDKREVGDGGCDPTIQASLSAARLWCQPEVGVSIAGSMLNTYQTFSCSTRGFVNALAARPFSLRLLVHGWLY
jgi:hypothetical protein